METDMENNNTPKISIIMPVYNTEDYLTEAIDSLLQQSLQSFEIICVDDGSTDSSLDILKDYASRDVRISVIEQNNMGAGAARNIGMEKAKGKYLLFLDSDDFFEPCLLESTYFRAEATEADIIIYASRIYNDATKNFEACDWAFRKEDFPYEVFSYKDNPDKILNSFQLCPWNKLFRKSFVEKNNLRWQEIKRTNDLFFCSVAMILAERIALVDEILVNYRTQTGKNLQATNYENPLDFYKALKKLHEYLLATGKLQNIEKSYYYRALRVCLYNLGANIRSGNDDSTAYVYEFIKYKGFKDLGISDYAIEHPENLEEIQTYNRIASKSLLHVLPGYKALEAKQRLTQTEKEKYKQKSVGLEKEKKGLIADVTARDKKVVQLEKQINMLNKQVEVLNKQIGQLNKQVSKLDKCEAALEKNKIRLRNMENSLSYRIGRAITFIPRKIRNLFTK